MPLRDGEEFYPAAFFLSRIIPMRELLGEVPAIVLSEGDKNKVLHGMDLSVLTGASEVDEYRLLDEAGELLALARRLQTFASPVAQPAHWVRIHPRIIFV